MSKATLSFLILSVFFFSCKKSSSPTPTPVNTTPVDPDTVTQYGTPFASVPDPKDVVMYEVNIHAFSSTHDLPGVTARLDSLKALGVNVVWLMPIYPVGADSRSVGSPYCVKDYLSVNPNFGTLSDLRTLVSTAHSLGMAVILDWVADQTSWDNAWITNTSWYHTSSAGTIISPNSGSVTYNDVAWLNYNNTDMRHAMVMDMCYWIKAANVDGYRCDFASNIPVDFWTSAIDTLKMLNHNKLVLLAENNAASDFNAGFQFDYSWNFYSALKTVVSAQQSAINISASNSSATENAIVPPGSDDYKLRFITNHDEEQSDGAPAVLYNGNTGQLAAFVLSAFVGGQPLIYNGDEVANTTTLTMYNNTTTIDWTVNAGVTAAYKKLLAFRSGSEAVKTGTLTYYNDANVAAFKRTSGSETVLVLVNTHNSTVSYTASTAIAGTTWKDEMNGGATVNIGTTVSLAPYQYMILGQ